MKWKIRCLTCGWQRFDAQIVGVGPELQRQALQADAAMLHTIQIGSCDRPDIEVMPDAPPETPYSC